MSDTDRHRILIEDRLRSDGFTADEWAEDPEDGGLHAMLGTWEATEDDPGGMFSSGEQGKLHAAVVGSQEYGNERVAYFLQVEGTELPVEARPFENIEFVPA